MPADSISTAMICRAILIQTDTVSSSLTSRSLEAMAPVIASGGRGAFPATRARFLRTVRFYASSP